MNPPQELDQTRKMVKFSNSIDRGLVASCVVHHIVPGKAGTRGNQPSCACPAQQCARREPSPATCASSGESQEREYRSE